MTQTANDKQAASAARKERSEAMSAKEKELNKGRTGIGLRVFLGLTRGKNPREIQYEAFDTEQKETLPVNLQQFADVMKCSEAELVRYAIEGVNEVNYTAASDPIAEHVDSSWDDDTVTRFRNVVRNYAAGAEVSIDEAVALMKPGFVKAYEKAQAAKNAVAPTA